MVLKIQNLYVKWNYYIGWRSSCCGRCRSKGIWAFPLLDSLKVDTFTYTIHVRLALQRLMDNLMFYDDYVYFWSPLLFFLITTQ